MTQTPIWERLETDTDKSFQAFCIYRDMGVKRSLRKVADKLSKSETIINRWSFTHNWVERTSAYDDYQATLRKERKERKQIEIEDNVLSDYDFLRACIQKRIETYTALNYKAEPYELQDLLGMMKQADDYARRAVGLPDKITESKNDHKVDGTLKTETTHKFDPTDMTDDELRNLITSRTSGD